MKTVHWQKLFVESSIWLIGEILLNLIGLNDLANYSEFIFEKKVIISTRNIAFLYEL